MKKCLISIITTLFVIGGCLSCINQPIVLHAEVLSEITQQESIAEPADAKAEMFQRIIESNGERLANSVSSEAEQSDVEQVPEVEPATYSAEISEETETVEVAEEPVVTEPSETVNSTEQVAVVEEAVEEVEPAPEPSYFVQGESGASVDIIRATNQYYCAVPENIRNSFQNGGWRIIVCNSSLGPRWGYSSILALTVYDTHTIYIDQRAQAAKEIMHEMGHYVDWASGFASQTGEFNTIWQAEVGTFCNYHSTASANTNTALEYFAEAFMQCIYDGGSMQSLCPQTYGYVMSKVNSL